MEPTPSETVKLPAALDLRRVAEWSGASMDEIERLNPEYRRWTTPIRPGEYSLRVPVGTADRVREGLARQPAGATERVAVVHGQERRIDLDDREKARRQSNRSRRGQLPAPDLTGVDRPTTADSSHAVGRPSGARVLEAPQTSRWRPPNRASDLRRTDAVVYRVRAGDTLSSIARRHGTTVDQLKAWNKMRDTRLNVGDRLVIQTSRVTNAQQN